jgi:shikimate kinase
MSAHRDTDASMSPVCVLVGPPGAGKTTVGQLVAARLGVTFHDADATIEEIAGKPIPEIFIDDGEDHFRVMEAAAVTEGVAKYDGVFALGGGAILADATRELLQGQTVVYLSVDLSDAIKRIGLGGGRPLLNVNPRATLRHLLDQRRPLYEAVATHTVATDDLDPDEVADAVVAALA